LGDIKIGKLADDVLELVRKTPGLTDREITNALKGTDAPQQGVNGVARRLATKGLLERKTRRDGLIGNYPTNNGHTVPSNGRPVPSKDNPQTNPNQSVDDTLSEDDLKHILKTWLEGQDWSPNIAWGKEHGIDIDAYNGDKRWIIEVKGPGSRQPMRVNYFLGLLGEILQHMSDPKARYSIALPDLSQFRSLWRHLPVLAKKRIGVSLLLVQNSGKVEELTE